MYSKYSKFQCIQNILNFSVFRILNFWFISEYSIEDFDHFDCLKLSKGVYFLLLFVLRGYLVWIMSVTNMQDRVGIIQWIYPDPYLFYLSLFSGLLALLVVLVISLRRPGAASWVRACWRHCRLILLICLLFDFTISLIGFLYWQLLSPSWLLVQAMIIAGFVVFIYRSHRFNINLKEFPEKLPE